jgi:hypothetical protein
MFHLEEFYIDNSTPFRNTASIHSKFRSISSSRSHKEEEEEEEYDRHKQQEE